jgi:O-antigen ligase
MLYAGVLFYLMLSYIRPQEFVPLITGWRLVFYTMLVLLPPWLVTLQWRKMLRTRIDLFMFLFWLIIIISWWTVWKSHMYSPAMEFGKTMISYLFVAHVIDTRRKLAGAVWMTLLTLMVVGMLGGKDVGLPGQYASIGLFNNRNDFAYAMAMLFPLGLAFFLKGDPFAKIVGAGACVVAIFEVGMSSSRGGAFALIIAGGAVFYGLARTRMGRNIMLVMGAVAFVTAITLSARLGSVTDYQQDASSMGRVEAWATALQLFGNHPIIGVGFQQFKKQDEMRIRVDTHNSYMRAISELGGTGLFIYIGLLWFTVLEARRIMMNGVHPNTRVIALGLFALVVGQAAASLFQTRTYHAIVLVQFALVSAMRLVDERDRLELETAYDVPGSQRVEDCRLWISSFQSGLFTRNLITKRDLKIIGVLTGLCWLMHKVFVMRSF